MESKDENNNKLNNLLETLSRQLGSDPEKLKKDVKSKNINEIVKNLNPKDAERIKKVFSNKTVASSILSSPKAQKLLKDLLGDK